MKTIAIGLVAMLLSASAAHAQQATTREREAMSAREAGKQMEQDLLSILKPDGRFDSGMFVMLRGAGFTTASYGTEIPGICAHDSMWLEYAPVSSDARDLRDNPVKPFALHLGHLFTFVRAPTADAITKFENERPSADAFRRECAHLSTTDDSMNWFGADDAITAAQGFLALQAAAARVQAGTLQPARCDLFPDDEKRGCAATLAILSKPENMGSVEECGSTADEQCFIVDAGSSKITITAKSGTVVRPDDVLSVKVEEIIVVT